MSEKLLELTADIVSAYVSQNPVPASDLRSLIADVNAALSNLGGTEAPPVKSEPAVNPKRSVHPDHIVCLEDGKSFQSLKRHLMAHHQMTPAQYRAKWDLGPDYPMVAPNYARKRSDLAKTLGLGLNPKAKAKAKKKPRVSRR